MMHPNAGLCEPGVIRPPEGGQLAMLLRENTHTMNSFVAFSDDGGATWSAPQELPDALICQGPINQPWALEVLAEDPNG